MIKSAHGLPDGRPRFIVCPRCHGHGPTAAPPGVPVPACFEPRPVLKHETVAELERIQSVARLFDSMPLAAQGALNRYIKKRIHPGSGLHALLRQDLTEFDMLADEATKQALVAMTAWLYEVAPSESWGSVEAVEAWLSGEEV